MKLNIDIILMLRAIFRKFKWNKIAILYEQNHLWEPLYTTLNKYAGDHPHELDITLKRSYVKYERYRDYENLTHVISPFLDDLPTKARSEENLYMFPRKVLYAVYILFQLLIFGPLALLDSS